MKPPLCQRGQPYFSGTCARVYGSRTKSASRPAHAACEPGQDCRAGLSGRASSRRSQTSADRPARAGAGIGVRRRTQRWPALEENTHASLCCPPPCRGRSLPLLKPEDVVHRVACAGVVDLDVIDPLQSVADDNTALDRTGALAGVCSRQKKARLSACPSCGII